MGGGYANEGIMTTATQTQPKTDRVYFWDPDWRQHNGSEEFYSVCTSCRVSNEPLVPCSSCGFLYCADHLDDRAECQDCAGPAWIIVPAGRPSMLLECTRCWAYLGRPTRVLPWCDYLGTLEKFVGEHSHCAEVPA